jgi:ATP-dependent DNA ligase
MGHGDRVAHRKRRELDPPTHKEPVEHEDSEIVFRHACKMGLEGIVSKRKGSPYRSGRSPDWLKMKNPACEAGPTGG